MREDGLRALDRLRAGGGQDDAGAGPVDECRAEDLLQLLDAGRERRLGDVRRLGRTAEGAVLGQELQVLQLADRREHATYIGRLYPEPKNNRLDFWISEAYLRVPDRRAQGG